MTEPDSTTSTPACAVSCFVLVDARARTAAANEGATALCMATCAAAGEHDAHRCLQHANCELASHADPAVQA